MDDTTGRDSGSGMYENNFLSYSSLTARHFKAENYCLAKAGIGITISWFPMIMSQMFDKLNPSDSTSLWNFSSYTPEIVVINVFQNDSWLIEKPNHPQFIAKFGTVKPSKEFIIRAYAEFVEKIRRKYNQAHIICALGNMDAARVDSPWPGYVEEAVKRLNDSKMHVLIFPFKNTPGHPKAGEQKEMADQLIAFIEKEMGW